MTIRHNRRVSIRLFFTCILSLCVKENILKNAENLEIWKMWLRRPPKLSVNWRENSSWQKIRGNSSIEQLHYNQEGANWRSWAAIKLINTCCESDEATWESLQFVLNVTVDRIVSVVSWCALQYWFFYYLVWSALVHGVPPVTNCHIYVVLSNMFSFWGWRSFNHVQCCVLFRLRWFIGTRLEN